MTETIQELKDLLAKVTVPTLNAFIRDLEMLMARSTNPISLKTREWTIALAKSELKRRLDVM